MTKRGCLRLGASLFAASAALFLSGILMVRLAQGTPLADAGWFPVAAAAMRLICFGLPVLYLLTRTMEDHVPQQPERCGVLRLLDDYFISMMLGYVGSFIGYHVSTALGQNEDMLTQTLDAAGPWSTLLLACVIAPLGEELFFRGVLLKKALAMGERAAVCFTALAFALLHMNARQFFYALFVGLLLGRVAARTGTVLWSWLLHVAVNITGSLVMPFLLSHDDYVPLAAWMLILFFLIGLAKLLRAGKYLRAPQLVEAGEGAGAAALFLNPGMLCYYALCAYGFWTSLQ